MKLAKIVHFEKSTSHIEFEKNQILVRHLVFAIFINPKVQAVVHKQNRRY